MRNSLDLTNALDIIPTYLRNPYSDQGIVTDYRNWQIPLGRRFRALKVWFVMRSYGLKGMKAYIRRTIEIGSIFASLVRERADLFEIVTKPAFALTVLRVRNPKTIVNGSANANGVSSDKPQQPPMAQVDETSNALTKKVYELINSRGEIFLTSTVVAGIYAIRVVSANPAADEQHMRRAFDILVSTTEEVLRGEAGNDK